MADEASSWIRRTKFSHTICHRLDSSRLASLPLSILPNNGLRARPRPTSSPQRLETIAKELRSSVSGRQRSVSPVPQTPLSETFMEAQLDKKRFSTPYPQRKEAHKGSSGLMCSMDGHKHYGSVSSKSGHLRHASPIKGHAKSKTKKEYSWAKYFDNGGGRIRAVDAVDEYMVDLSKLFLGLRFAHGAHSRLYHGVYKDEPVAVKIIRVTDDDENGTMACRLAKQFNREVTLLSRLHHPNILKFIAACREPPVYCVITEYLSEGSLRAYLHKLENRSLTLENLIRIALDIARGMEYVHSQGMIHRDLKPENVIISDDFHMKIADFGIACEEPYCDPLADDPGTFRWMAPEMIKHKHYGRKVDVYSFGLILWELLAGAIPYEEMTPVQAAFAVVNKNLRPVIPVNCPPAMRALVEQCWASQPEKRPEFWQLAKVLEEFSTSLAQTGTLNSLPDMPGQDHKKGLLHWIQKLHPNDSIALKPKFAA